MTEDPRRTSCFPSVRDLCPGTLMSTAPSPLPLPCSAGALWGSFPSPCHVQVCFPLCHFLCTWLTHFFSYYARVAHYLIRFSSFFLLSFKDFVKRIIRKIVTVFSEFSPHCYDPQNQIIMPIIIIIIITIVIIIIKIKKKTQFPLLFKPTNSFAKTGKPNTKHHKRTPVTKHLTDVTASSETRLKREQETDRMHCSSFPISFTPSAPFGTLEAVDSWSY